MYADESGDTGLQNSPSDYFILSGLVIHETKWRQALNILYEFKKRMAKNFNLRVREEIHASKMITRPGKLKRIKRNDRLTILRHFIKEISSLPDARIINIAVNKTDKPAHTNIFEIAWETLIQRFENTIKYENFSDGGNTFDKGMLFPDEGSFKKLKNLLRRMRYYNPVPYQLSRDYRNLKLEYTIEDPNFRSSHDSFFIQVVDTVAFFLLQKIKPTSYIRKKGAGNYFDRLDKILCKECSKSDPQGIVWL